jgi:hypothetical protein
MFFQVTLSSVVSFLALIAELSGHGAALLPLILSVELGPRVRPFHIVNADAISLGLRDPSAGVSKAKLFLPIKRTAGYENRMWLIAWE